MRRQAGEVDDLRLDGDLLTEQLDLGSAVQQAAAQTALCLIAHEDHGALLPPQIMLQMMADTACIAHTAGRNDDLGHLVGVQSTGLLGGFGEPQIIEGQHLDAVLHQLNGLLIQITGQITGENGGGGLCQRTVHIYREVGHRGHQPPLLDLPDEIQQFLGTSHCKGRDDHVAALGKGAVQNPCQILGIFAFALPVFPVAVGAFGDDIIGLAQIGRIPDDGLLDIADIARKDDLAGLSIFGDGKFNKGRAQQVSGIHKTDVDAGAQLKGLVVIVDLDVVQGQLGVLGGIERLHHGATGPLALLVGPLSVALLNVGAVHQHDIHQLGGQTGGVHLTGVAHFIKDRHSPGVVDVGMGSKHIIHLAGMEGQLVVVDLITTLLQTAVNEDALAAGLQTMTAAGNSTGSTIKRQLHGSSSFDQNR